MDKKYIIIRRKNQILSLLFHNNRLVNAYAEEEGASLLGNIYIAKVQNVTKNIDAAFLMIEPGVSCFLSLAQVRKPLLLNRLYDGRLLSGDELVVQVYKDAAKTKPPSVTCELSLDGKYCAVLNGKPGIACSSKLSAKAKQRILNEVQERLYSLSKEFGIIIRTNARELDGDFTPLTEEACRLSGQLSKLIETAPHRTCYSILSKKPAQYLLTLRDVYAKRCDEIITDESDIYESICEYSKENPDFQLPSVRLYQDAMLPLAKLYAVDTRLSEALGRKIWLKSGGYLIIEPTEALTVIDVNTGKSGGKKNNEETYYTMNMEAAVEIAAQLALRNLSGIILVDFINMKQEEHKRELMAHLGNLLKQDPVKTSLIDITALGLAEITRMKTSSPLREQLKRNETE